MTVAMALGRRLREWRHADGLSLAAAALHLGVHPSTYQRWEQGRRPYPRRLKVIADVLGDDLATVTALAGPAPRRTGRPAPADASILMRARLRAALNRVELGRALHVGPATVYQWERGNVRPPEDLLDPLAGCLRISRQELVAALADHPCCRYDGEVLPRLGAVLRRMGWTRGRVRQFLGVSPSTIFAWETGRTRVPSWALQRLADGCNVEVDQLIADARRNIGPAPAVTTLAALRRRVRMTQREAAAVLGTSASSLGRYETGRRPVALPLARSMARAYRVPLARVLAAARQAPPPRLLTSRWTHDELPAVLTDLRRAVGLSMSHVARCTGVSHPTVRRWERGESTPSAGALRRLELEYELRRGRLTELAGSKEPGSARPSGTWSTAAHGAGVCGSGPGRVRVAAPS